jgi:hypothetical protein
MAASRHDHVESNSFEPTTCGLRGRRQVAAEAGGKSEARQRWSACGMGGSVALTYIALRFWWPGAKFKMVPHMFKIVIFKS